MVKTTYNWLKTVEIILATLDHLFIIEVIITNVKNESFPPPTKGNSFVRVLETIKELRILTIQKCLEDDECLIQIPHKHCWTVHVCCFSRCWQKLWGASHQPSWKRCASSIFCHNFIVPLAFSASQTLKSIPFPFILLSTISIQILNNYINRFLHKEAYILCNTTSTMTATAEG